MTDAFHVDEQLLALPHGGVVEFDIDGRTVQAQRTNETEWTLRTYATADGWIVARLLLDLEESSPWLLVPTQHRIDTVDYDNVAEALEAAAYLPTP